MHGWPAHIIHTYVRTVDDITLLSCSSSSLSSMAVRKHTDTVEPPLVTFLTFLYSTPQSPVQQTSAVVETVRVKVQIFCMQPYRAMEETSRIISFIAAHNVPHKSADALLYMVHVGTSQSHAQIRACRGQNTQFSKLQSIVHR